MERTKKIKPKMAYNWAKDVLNPHLLPYKVAVDH